MKVCIPTILRFDLLDEAIELYKQDDAVTSIWIIDNSCGDYKPRLYDAEQKVPVTVIVPETSMTVPQSWNYFIQHLEGDLLIANDDAFPRPGCVTAMQGAIDEDEDKEISIFFGCVVDNESEHDNNYSMFSVRMALWREIGGFSEAFSPGYYEDCDFDWQRRLLGRRAVTVMDAQYTHVGSATIKAHKEANDVEWMKTHNRQMFKNARHYTAKWGGLPGREVYKTPFNKG